MLIFLHISLYFQNSVYCSVKRCVRPTVSRVSYWFICICAIACTLCSVYMAWTQYYIIYFSTLKSCMRDINFSSLTVSASQSFVRFYSVQTPQLWDLTVESVCVCFTQSVLKAEVNWWDIYIFCSSNVLLRWTSENSLNIFSVIG